MGSLGDLLRDRRAALGLTQVELALLAGVNQPLVSDIERGKTKLSNPDARRRIAKALRVRHVDLLVAAGELWPEEVPGGQPPVIESPYPEIMELLGSVDLNDDRRWGLIHMLSGWRERDRRLGRDAVEETGDEVTSTGFD